MHTAPTASPTVELVPATLQALSSMWCPHLWVSVCAASMLRVRPVTDVNLCTGTSPPTLLTDAPTASVTWPARSAVLQSVHRSQASVTANRTPAVGPAPPVKTDSTTCRSKTTSAVRAVSATSGVQPVSHVERGTAAVAADQTWRDRSATFLALTITSPTSII